MHRIKSIFLLSILALLLSPWSIVDFCIAHPTGHCHHHHPPGELSPCQLRKQYTGSEPAIFPPMECHKFSMDADDYQRPLEFNPTLVSATPAQQAMNSSFANQEILPTSHLRPPDPLCRSGPYSGPRQLRAPPFVLILS